MMLSMVEIEAAPGPLGILSCVVECALVWMVWCFRVMLSATGKRGYDVSGWTV